MLTDAAERVGVLVTRVVPDPVPVGESTATVTEDRRVHPVVGAVVHRKRVSCTSSSKKERQNNLKYSFVDTQKSGGKGQKNKHS